MKDYNIKNMFSKSKNAFAIEMEIHESLRNYIQTLYPKVYWKLESNNIAEINDIHQRKGEERKGAMLAFDFLKAHYKDKFPIGSNLYTSGGNHFHLFGINKSDVENKGLLINHNLLACPLFAKFSEGKLYTRKNQMYLFNRYGNNNIIHTRDKGSSVVFNYVEDSFSSFYEANNSGPLSIEFRCNNVIDDRILGYYQGIYLLTKNDITLAPLSTKTIKYLKTGDQYTRDSDEPRGDRHVSVLNGRKLTRGDVKKMNDNIITILNCLKNEGLVNSADKLTEYCIENNLLFNPETTGLLQD